MRLSLIALTIGLIVLALGSVGVLTVTALRQERDSREALERAALEESVRLALWRLDSALVSLIGAESLAPRPGGRSEPRPFDPDHVRFRFRLAASSGERLPGLDVDAVIAQLAPPPESPVVEPSLPVQTAGRVNLVAEAQRFADAQDALNQGEFDARSQNLLYLNQSVVNAGVPLLPVDAGTTDVLGPLQPVWQGDDLVLATRTRSADTTWLAGTVIDWPSLEQELTASIRDLLPAATLTPEPISASEPGRRLATLPVTLHPGGLPLAARPAASPLNLTLWGSWVGVSVAMAALLVMIWTLHALSERRRAFVSSVTHELRTPLTTFRLYTEMLAEGMVDERERATYLGTLRREADRLSHLVENVLTYARLERKPATRLEASVTRVSALIDHAWERLGQRCREAGLELVLEGELDGSVKADPAAVEQILFNLIDNACKFAAGGGDTRVHVHIQNEATAVRISVVDHGPGVPPRQRRRLFRPFVTSSQEATDRGSPGVGLGLDLSRRIARSMGGDLRLGRTDGTGACFALTLPRALASE